jgi:hypothetical protein
MKQGTREKIRGATKKKILEGKKQKQKTEPCHSLKLSQTSPIGTQKKLPSKGTTI